MSDYEVIAAVIRRLQEHGHPELTISCYPDKVNRSSTDIDAIAGRFAIEHTSIDTIRNQRLNNDWFGQVIGGLEQDFRGQFPFKLSITIPYDAITKGQDWTAIRTALKSWIRGKSPHLGYGKHNLHNIPGIPFQLDVDKQRSQNPSLVFLRPKPQDDTLSCRIKKLFDRKAKKLKKYKDLGKTTVLLIESNDIALMGIQGWKILNAIREAYPLGLPIGIDEIWYVDTAELPELPDMIGFKNFTPDLLMR